MSLARRLLTPPRFDDEDATERARLLHQVAWGTAIVVSLLVPAVMLAQPDTIGRALRAIVVVSLAASSALALNYKGHTRAGSLLFVASLIILITITATDGGGLTSPGHRPTQ